MIPQMLSETRLREVLRQVEGATDVLIDRDGSKLIAMVVSPAFAGKDEYLRQTEVSALLLEHFSDEEHAQVGFVFTNTPEEKSAAERNIDSES